MFLNKIILILLLIFQIIIIYNGTFIIQVENSSIKKEKFKIINELFKVYNKFLYSKKDLNLNQSNTINNFINASNKILLCVIGKNENLYAKEFIDYYYYNLGFDKIIIFDNNDLNGEKFEDILKNYISLKFVEIIDVRELKYIQLACYNYCYRKNMKAYDWIAFFDFDEYLFINKNYTLKNYLSNNVFNNCQSIIFNWHEYNDNDLLRYDNRTLIQRFTNLKWETNMTKFMVRGNLSDIIINSMHFPTNINFCNSKGVRYKDEPLKMLAGEKNSIAHIRHYRTKTAEEYCNKILRGDAQFGLLNKNRILLKINKNFFACNNKTPEKIKIFEKCLNISI